MNDVAMEFFKRDDSKFLREFSTMTLAIKCPLFVQLHLSTFNLNIMKTPVVEQEAYLPNVGEVGALDLETSRNIAANIKATTDALLLNPKAYEQDGCNRFISQVSTPINTYTTLLVHGSYSEWKRFCDQSSAPLPLRSYIKAVTQIMNAEWH